MPANETLQTCFSARDRKLNRFGYARKVNASAFLY
jgi:hypothetical protein